MEQGLGHWGSLALLSLLSSDTDGLQSYRDEVSQLFLALVSDS